MLNQFDDLLLLTAGEGASAPVAVAGNDRAGVADALMSAWSRECHDRIEAALVLDKARVLLERILDEEPISTPIRRKVERFLRATRAAHDS